MKDSLVTQSKSTISNGVGGSSFTQGIGLGFYENLCLRDTCSTWAGEGMAIHNSVKPQNIRRTSMTSTPSNRLGDNFLFPRGNKDTLREAENNYSHSAFQQGHMLIAWASKEVFVAFITLAFNLGSYVFNDEYGNECFELEDLNIVNNSKVNGQKGEVFYTGNAFTMKISRAVFIGNDYNNFNSGNIEVKDCVFFGNKFPASEELKTRTHLLIHQDDWECITNHPWRTASMTLRTIKRKALYVSFAMIS